MYQSLNMNIILIYSRVIEIETEAENKKQVQEIFMPSIAVISLLLINSVDEWINGTITLRNCSTGVNTKDPGNKEVNGLYAEWIYIIFLQNLYPALSWLMGFCIESSATLLQIKLAPEIKYVYKIVLSHLSRARY